MPFETLSKRSGRELIPGYRGKFVHSSLMTVAHWDIKAGHRVPEHAHSQEMLVNLIEGTFEMTIDGEVHRMNAGDVAIVPPNAVHSALAITDCKAVDVFSPPRPDYQN